MVTIGNTPLFRLERLPEPGSADIFAKFEGANLDHPVDLMDEIVAVSAGSRSLFLTDRGAGEEKIRDVGAVPCPPGVSSTEGITGGVPVTVIPSITICLKTVSTFAVANALRRDQSDGLERHRPSMSKAPPVTSWSCARPGWASAATLTRPMLTNPKTDEKT